MAVLPLHLHDLEKRYIDAHHDEYKFLTRLILTYSIGALTFLISFYQQYARATGAPQWLAGAALAGLLLSAVAGLVIQHCMMHNYLRWLEEARVAVEDANRRGDPSPLQLRKRPSRLERVCYKIQIFSFSGSFLLLVVFTVLNLMHVK
jgi:hypothetical protein